MALVLFHSPNSRSARVRWLLEELDIEYAIKLVPREERTSDEHRRRHPLGRVPALETDQGTIFETAAICLHLAEQHPEAGLLPPEGSFDRALVYQWISFGLTEIEPPTADVRRHADSDPERAETARERVRAAIGVITGVLDGREYLLGRNLSVADILCGSALFGARRLELTADVPAVEAYLDRLEARPARQRAYAAD